MKSLLVILGTILPFLGIYLTFQLANRFKVKKEFILVIGPILTLFLCMMFGSQISQNGNMLFAAVFAIFIIFLVIYYPVLIILGLGRHFKRKDK